MQDCGTGHGVRSDDMNGLAEMERSQVTPDRTCVAPVPNVPHRRRVQHTLQEFLSWL